MGYQLPKRFRNRIKELIRYAGLDAEPDRFAGFLVVFGLELSLALSLIVGLFFGASPIHVIMLFILSYAAFVSLMILALSMIADSRTKKVETILPDALQLMASNMKAGLIPSRALWSAARPEFGPLKEEVQRIAKLLMTGKDLKNAIKSLTMHIKSKILGRTVELISEGMEGGGELSRLLEETAEDIRQTMEIREDIKASVRMYIVLVFIAAGMGSPVLFGISTFLIETITSFRAGMTIPDVPQTELPMSMGMLQEAPLDTGFLIAFSLLMITVVTFFGSIILGLISTGREKEGLRYVPALITIALVLFFATRMLMNLMFGSLFL